jgi:decaprenylphospho-beta-D-erythro-pentofuranosid-2-ulose 2-reductase
MKNLLIIGGKSDIGKEIEKQFICNGFNIVLAGRSIENDNSFVDELSALSNNFIKNINFDICDFQNHKDFYKNINPKPDGVVVVSGYMADQKNAEIDFEESLNTINVNYLGPVSILNIIANEMEKSKKGFIIGISSVAGDRGRRSNYIYGSSKAAFSTYLSGLRNRLSTSNIQVLTVKPGFVYTKMTKHLDLPSILTAKPEKVAIDIFNAYKRRKSILYTRGIWRLIMLIIKIIPESIFRRTNL